MAGIVAELADGRRLEFPEGTDPAVVQATVKRLMQQPAEPASVQAGRAISQSIPRQIGLAARYAAEGLPALADLVWEPARQLAVNPALRAAGLPQLGSMAQAGKGLADVLGLPSPETADERVVGDASRLVASTIGGAGAARGILGAMGASTAPTAGRGVLEALAANPGTQAAAAAGSGLAGGSVREAGGGDLAQFGASLAGGLGGAAAAQGASAAGGAISRALRPRDIDATLSATLERQGIDWSALGESVRKQLREDAKKAIYSGQPLDGPALQRLAQYRQIGATPLLGDITQDARLVTLQRNLAKQQANMSTVFGGDDLAGLTNQNAQRVLSVLDGATKSNLDEGGTARGIIGVIQSRDASRKAMEDVLYREARAAAGRDIPLDRGAFVQQAFGNLAQQNKTAFLPDDIGNLLNQISKGTVTVGGKEYPVPFDVNTIDTLKTTLATASRGAKDGNVRAAIAAVRDALENAQPALSPSKTTFGGGQVVTQAQGAAMQAADEAPAAAMALFDRARAAARERRTWGESAPFIKAALDDADPEKFVQQHVIAGRVDDLQKMAGELKNAPALREAVRKQMVDYIMRRGSADSSLTTFSSKGMQDGFRQLGRRRMEVFFSPDEIQQIEAAIGVARSLQSQPVGSAVNNSNTGAMLAARVSELLTRATGLPIVGPLAAEPVRAVTLKMAARELQDLSRGLTTAPPLTATQPASLAAPAAVYGGLLPLLGQQ